MKAVSTAWPRHAACRAGAPGRWGTKKRLNRVKWGRSGFGDQRNLEWSAVLAGVVSYWRSRQPQPPCLDRMRVSRILMNTRGKEREREDGGSETLWKMRQNRRRMRRKIEYRPAKKGLEKKSSGGREVWIMTRMDGMPFIWASCNAVTCGSETCSQRPCVSSETSETDTLHSSQKCQQQGGTTPDFFLFYSFFFPPTAAITPHMQHEESLVTRVFTEDHDSVTSFACQMIVHDCAVISWVPCSFPHSMHYYHSHTVSLHGVTVSK